MREMKNEESVEMEGTLWKRGSMRVRTSKLEGEPMVLAKKCLRGRIPRHCINKTQEYIVKIENLSLRKEKR